MSTISVTLPNDGETMDAADVNTPLTTIVNTINGGINSDNLSAAAVTPAKLSSNLQNGWEDAILPAVSSVAANGNHSYNITFGSTVAALTSAGQRFRTTRTVAAPTQCTSLNGTTQYYSKTTPAGMTFTNNFVVSAWVKLTSYANAFNAIASRFNGTSGWTFQVENTGQLRLVAFNAGGGNSFQSLSYQSIPLNKWVHVSAQLDMTTTSTGGTNNYMMIDGVEVPNTCTRAGTNPTALIQAGNLEIGSDNAGIDLFLGKIAQVAIYNAKVTQATILASMNQTLSGSETSLISAYSFNNTINDLNANANNLTANGAAVATNADSPFGGQADGTISATLDYGIVTKVATTVATVQVPEGCTIPTTGGVSSVDLSAWKAPFNMPVQRGKWIVQMINKVNSIQSSPSNGTWYNLTSTSGTTGGHVLNIPIGEWMYGYEVLLYAGRSGSANGLPAYATLSTGSSSESDNEMRSKVYLAVNSAVDGSIGSEVTRRKELSLTSATPYYLNAMTDLATTADIDFLGGQCATKIFAELAHL